MPSASTTSAIKYLCASGPSIGLVSNVPGRLWKCTKNTMWKLQKYPNAVKGLRGLKGLWFSFPTRKWAKKCISKLQKLAIGTELAKSFNDKNSRINRAETGKRSRKPARMGFAVQSMRAWMDYRSQNSNMARLSFGWSLSEMWRQIIQVPQEIHKWGPHPTYWTGNAIVECTKLSATNLNSTKMFQYVV